MPYPNTLGLTLLIAGLIFAPLAIHLAVAQAPLVKRPIPAGDPAVKVKAGDDADEAMKDLAETKFPGGAPLKTDPEQQRLLKRAEICVEDGRFDLATVLWQKVLDEAGDTLMTRDGRFYTSLAEEVERTIIKLPPEALRTYRLTADGQAELILSQATAGDEEDALAQVVRRYFMSAAGDDAAYKLACLALDRHDFVGASRLLAKIMEQHPDPSMPPSEVLLRLSVASARMGDREAAGKWLTRYASAGGERPSSEVFDMVLADVQQAMQQAVAAGATAENWPMTLGGPSRTGHQRSLPSEATARTLTEAWVHQFPIAASDGMQQNPWGGMMGAMGLHGRPFNANGRNVAAIAREPLVSQWRQHAWMPTAGLLFDKGLVIVKTADELAAFNVAAVESKPVWQTFMKNEYVLDGQTADMSRMQMQGGMQGQTNNQPRSAPEVFLFGDRVHQAMSLHNGIVYTIEGRQFHADSPTLPGQSLLSKPWQWNVTPRRTRSNFLAAYHVRTGKFAGHRAASDEDKEGSQDVGFLGAPIGFGNLIIAPVTDGGAIWLYAMEDARLSKEGKYMPTVWKSYLCDEPSAGSDAWSTIVPALDGRDLYVTCGTGVVFAVDAVSGNVRWAVRYQRDGKPDLRMRNYGNQQNRIQPEGFEDDVVIPHGRSLIVMASDSNTITSLDRRTGEILWTSPRTDMPTKDDRGVTYCLGIKDNLLYLAGQKIIRTIKLPGGRIGWDREIEHSYGHGALTADALYIPVKDSILKLDLKTGAELGQVGVALPTDDPVGNVYSDGQKLWVAGAGRIYAMTTLEHRLKTLSEQIAAGDPEAQLTRMRLMFKDKKLESALTDLRGAYQLFRQKTDPEESVNRLFLAIHELKLPQEEPLIALGLLHEFFVSGSPPPLTGELKAKRADVLLSSLRIARQKKSPGLTPAILQLASLLDSDHLVHSAAAAIQASATPADRDSLVAAVDSAVPNAQAIAVSGFAKIAGADAKDSLTKAVTSGDERVKLAAARALANLGERDSLNTFLALLSADNSRTRLRSHQALRAMTGQAIAFSAEGKPEDRAKSVEAWKKWVDTEGKTAKLTIPLPETDVPLGRTLFVSFGQSTIVELDADRKERWRHRLSNPWACQGLPNGNRLIAAFAQNQNIIVEYSEDGKEIWKKEKLPSIPYSVQRLENGSTLVCCADVQQVLEIAPDLSTKSTQVAGRPMYAQRLDNGNTLIALQQGGRVVEMDAKNQTVWEARGMNGPCFCQRLDTGNTLIVQMHTGQVVEVDASGQKTVWNSKVPLVNPICAQRLTNGNTLIADNNGVIEVDPTGQKVIWRHAQNNVTGVSQF
ncbi:outer membrane biogenesis protein BamB [Anatilimnocola aggregata]|uniref:Outer membrane biogenesis protein BamB n=2 Tax=Anatilimnocola aggregata TaxID=2528021 RepID=A0A517YL71_9BACT|nr:outer membrane biogenesis protein BamB [Anatilimnocola aggregata]